MTELNEDEMAASCLACLLAAIRGDLAGISVLLDEMNWAQLRFVAESAMHAAADGMTSGRDAPGPDGLDMQVTKLTAQIAALRAQASL